MHDLMRVMAERAREATSEVDCRTKERTGSERLLRRNSGRGRKS